MKRQYDYCIFIGRLQPPHKAHIDNIRRALELANKAIVIFGSHRAARNPKNPFTAKERENMIRANFSPEDNERIICTSVRDYYYNDNIWVADVQEKVSQLVEERAKICLLGLYKDHSSYYLDLFPQWKRETVSDRNVMNATDVRNLFFNPEAEIRQTKIIDMVGQQTWSCMLKWVHDNPETYATLTNEWLYYEKYKQDFSNVPYPVTFVTTDVVVVKSGHVLLVKRKVNPGKGLLALPGGFIKPELTVLNNALEELKEETRIMLPKNEILKNLKGDKVFDHPNRSLRGRTITHAFYFELPSGGELPKVKGSDDAEHAMWIPINDVFAREDEMFEDHVHIISWFYSRGR